MGTGSDGYVLWLHVVNAALGFATLALFIAFAWAIARDLVRHGHPHLRLVGPPKHRHG